jgi:hypothetical protein
MATRSTGAKRLTFADKARIYRDVQAAEREVQRERNRRWRAANPEKSAAAARKWREANPEEARLSRALYAYCNQEKQRAAKAAWRARNPNYHRERNRRLAAAGAYRKGGHYDWRKYRKTGGAQQQAQS